MSTQQPVDATTPHPQRWPALALLGVAQLMLILDVTVVAVALPQLGADLGMGRESLTWVVTAYTLVFGGLMLTGGRMADVAGPTRVVLSGLAVFVGASLLAGLAWSPTVILTARAGQGLGAALMSPAALSLVVRLFDSDERNRALAIWSSLGGVGAALGVLLGGVITAGPGWHWVFLINVPIGTVVVATLPRLLPKMPPVAPTAKLDGPGAILGTAAVAALIFAFIDAGNRAWTSTLVVGLLLAAAAMVVALVARLRTGAHPLVDPALVARRPVLAGTFILFVATALMVAIFFLGTFRLQQVADYGPLATGLLFLPIALATMSGAQIAGRVIARTGPRPLAAGGMLVAAVGMGIAATSGTLTSVVAVSLASGGLGALFVVAAAVALSSVEPHQAGVASGLLSTFHEIGAALGAAAMSGVAAGSLTSGNVVGIRHGYAVAAVVAAGGALGSLLLLKGHAEHQDHASTRRHSVRTFVRHYVEMILAMLLGMALYPLWTFAIRGISADSWLHRVEVGVLVMATAMSIPMAAWMIYRQHRARLTIEMVAAMFAGFIVLFPLLWTQMIDSMGLMMAGHVLMPLFMLAAMFYRREAYLSHGGAHH